MWLPGQLFPGGEGLIDVLLRFAWLMLPVYMANNCATLFGGGRPLDGGRQFFDGRRLLGDHKTLKGFGFGVLGGMAVGLAEALVAPHMSQYIALLAGSVAFMQPPALALVALPLGALTGDAAKSFCKRRLGIPSGARWPVADQLDFVLGAWALAALADPAWFFGSFSPGVLVLALILTFPLQVFHNTIAVWLGKKKVRW